MGMQKLVNSVFVLVGVTLTLTGNIAAAQIDSSVTLSSGAEYTRGDYGGTQDVEDWYFPFTVNVDTGRIAYRLTVPYLRVRAPEGTVVTEPGGSPVTGAGKLKTESGLGDIVGSITFYDLINNLELGVAVDLTGKVKLGSADEDDGLGTGENDYSLQLDTYKYFDQFALLGSVGYKVRGEPSGIELENVVFGAIGGVYRLPSENRLGVIFDYRESAIRDGDSVRELSAFFTHKLDKSWQLQYYALAGFSDSSPDWGAGMRIKLTIDAHR